MKYKKLIIYGGTSEISQELINLYFDKTESFIIFCRSKEKFHHLLKKKNFYDKIKEKIETVEIDLYDLNENLNRIKKIENDISGIFWIAGCTGDGIKEYEKIDQAEKNIKINFLNPVIILSEISKKMILMKKSRQRQK